MANSRIPKTRDELAKGFFRMYMAGQQWKAKLAADEITEAELWEKAYDKADERIYERMENLIEQKKLEKDWTEEDQKYREDREERYREDYDWSMGSDEKILQNLLDVEMNIRQIKRAIAVPKILAKDRDMLMDRHTDLVKTHSKLLQDAGIDRVTREKKKQTSDPMEDWERVKELAKKKMAELESEYTSVLENVSSEAELRDKIKFHLGYPFNIVDATLKAHRRVLNLPTEVQKG